MEFQELTPNCYSPPQINQIFNMLGLWIPLTFTGRLFVFARIILFHRPVFCQQCKMTTYTTNSMRLANDTYVVE